MTRIFTTPRTITACWAHYLIFDLFVGAWEARDCERLGMKHLAVVPSLFLTLMFGPVGLLSWLAIRAIAKRRRALVEADPVGGMLVRSLDGPQAHRTASPGQSLPSQPRWVD